MIKCIIVDDEVNNIEMLQQLIQQYSPNLEVIATAINADRAKQLILAHQPDLLFLDIQMPHKNGFDLLRELPKVNFEIIFVTAFDQYGIQAVKFSALDYLLKPIDISEFVKAIYKAEQRIADKRKNKNLENLLQNIQVNSNTNPSIALPTLQEIRYVKIKYIVRCQADDNYTKIYIEGGEELIVSRTLKEYDELLTPYQFLRTHQSHLINRLFIKSLLKEDGGTILMQDQTKIPISRQRKEKIKRQIINTL